MKLRRNELVLIECFLTKSPIIRLAPILLAGGPAAETNRVAMANNMERIFGEEWSARIVRRFRSRRHFSRWLNNSPRWTNRRLERWQYP